MNVRERTKIIFPMDKVSLWDVEEVTSLKSF